MAIATPSDRLIILGPGCAPIPESLLLAHARGRVLFVTGAGTSLPANVPDFRTLVVRTYETIDAATHTVLSQIPNDGSMAGIDLRHLTDKQKAEVHQFNRAYYDVALGMLERRIDGVGSTGATVRDRIATVLREASRDPAAIHHSLIRLADRGGACCIVTTNFDLLLEAAAKRQHRKMQSYSLGAIPRPSRNLMFAGILHIHGALDPDANRSSDFIVSDEDFGEFYMRRRAVPDFIYDAARLFSIVLVGYSANDPPMRYLLSAVAADGSRFEDFKERFAFVGSSTPADTVVLEEWRSRGITPISYDKDNGHGALLATLQAWAKLSAINGKPEEVAKLIRKIVKVTRGKASDEERDLFDHLVRRADPNEQIRLANVASQAKAELGWLDAILAIIEEPDRSGA